MTTHNQLANTKEFYDIISEIYDDMTNFQLRLNIEMRTLNKWLEKYKISSVFFRYKRNFFNQICGS